jgi:hypothetical protein
LNRRRVLLILGALALVAARLCHSGVLWPEEGLPLAAAVQMLQGKVLFHDVWFDKPPLVTVFYLLFGAHIGVPLRIAGALYVLAACWLIWRFAKDLWGPREAAAAAGFLGFALTFYLPAAVMAVAADLLVVAPHIAAVWLAWKGRHIGAGIAAGIAFQCNTKAAFIFAVCALFDWRGIPRLMAGFAVPNAFVLLWLGIQGALADYVEQVWTLGFVYARDTFVRSPWKEAFQRTLNWTGFHLAFVIAAILAWRRERNWRFAGWLLLVLPAVVAGWRFFPRYYFHLLPVVVLLAARGFVLAGTRVRVALLALLLIPLGRFGPRYVTLAVAGESGWRDTAMDRDSRAAARLVLDRARPGETLFVWGYRPEIYAYTRMPAASRFLESQPLTGVFADRHLFDSAPSYPEWAARNRLELVRTRPAFVLDGLAGYNPNLGIGRYPDLARWLQPYMPSARTPLTVIYTRNPAAPPPAE